MTFFIKCNGCKKIEVADDNGTYPSNPINPSTGQRWWSRTKDGKTIHACSRECMDEGLVWPV